MFLWRRDSLYVLLRGGQQGASQRQAVRPLPALLPRAVPNAIFLVHHLLQQRLVIGVERRHGDVPHGPELAAVVQMLVLQTEEIPHEAPAGGKSAETVDEMGDGVKSRVSSIWMLIDEKWGTLKGHFN